MYIITKINPKMLEPATASIGLYLLAKTPLHINRGHKILKRNPFYLKKKVCRWFHENHHTILDSVIDETNEYVLDSLNHIVMHNFNPSLFILIYMIALLLVIIF